MTFVVIWCYINKLNWIELNQHDQNTHMRTATILFIQTCTVAWWCRGKLNCASSFFVVVLNFLIKEENLKHLMFLYNLFTAPYSFTLHFAIIPLIYTFLKFLSCHLYFIVLLLCIILLLHCNFPGLDQYSIYNMHISREVLSLKKKMFFLRFKSFCLFFTRHTVHNTFKMAWVIHKGPSNTTKTPVGHLISLWSRFLRVKLLGERSPHSLSLSLSEGSKV